MSAAPAVRDPTHMDSAHCARAVNPSSVAAALENGIENSRSAADESIRSLDV